MENKSEKKEGKRSLRRIVATSLWCLFIGGTVTAFLLIWLISKGALGYLPPLEELQNPKNTYASEVISSDMQSLGRYYRYENRIGVQYTDLSPDLINALVATEDARFYAHTGVDFKGWRFYPHPAVVQTVVVATRQQFYGACDAETD